MEDDKIKGSSLLLTHVRDLASAGRSSSRLQICPASSRVQSICGEERDVVMFSSFTIQLAQAKAEERDRGASTGQVHQVYLVYRIYQVVEVIHGTISGILDKRHPNPLLQLRPRAAGLSCASVLDMYDKRYAISIKGSSLRLTLVTARGTLVRKELGDVVG